MLAFFTFIFYFFEWLLFKNSISEHTVKYLNEDRFTSTLPLGWDERQTEDNKDSDFNVEKGSNCSPLQSHLCRSTEKQLRRTFLNIQELHGEKAAQTKFKVSGVKVSSKCTSMSYCAFLWNSSDTHFITYPNVSSCIHHRANW